LAASFVSDTFWLSPAAVQGKMCTTSLLACRRRASGFGGRAHLGRRETASAEPRLTQPCLRVGALHRDRGYPPYRISGGYLGHPHHRRVDADQAVIECTTTNAEQPQVWSRLFGVLCLLGITEPALAAII
jgi:hypothetical protein